MAAVLENKDTAATNGSQVDEQLAQATSRIRAHDLSFGGLVLVALVLVYTTGMIVLDRYLNLPEWVRQVALLGFVATLAGVAYLTLLSPLRKRINPLYAAKQVESTIEDAKNSVTGYVDARQKGDLNPTVKAALASRAAKAAAEADVNRAVDHRSLIYLGGVAIALLLVLVVLFFVFRPAQFSSLVGRTYVPFSSDPIASRTQLELLKPDPVEPTITTGQSISVAVHVGGKVPSADSPEKVRLLIRHNQADPNYDELPMVPGNTSRDWELRVPDYLVQNGFWYKVVGGDAATPEYRVTVRSLPMFTEFQATYQYPKYLRRKPDTTNDPVIRAYRGTTVTLVARANREVRDGLMVIEPSNARVAGTAVPGKPDSVQFAFKVTEAGKYKLTFTATNGERSADPFQSTIGLESDAAPIVVITKPEEPETTEPANGLLKIDGKVGDDFGIDTVTLKMKIVAPVERPLEAIPYTNGKSTSFRRAKDDTWPTDLDYKGSVDLTKLKKDVAGVPLELTPDMVIEYWLEATDNCTEPKPNVGRSQPKRVRLTVPKTDEMDQNDLDQQKDARRNEEKKHDDNQKQKFNNEKRPQNGGQKGDGKPQEGNNAEGNDKKQDGNAKPGDKNGGKGDNAPGKPDAAKNPPDGKSGNSNDKGAMGDQSMPPMMPMGPDNPPMNTDPNGGMGQPNPAPMPSTADQKKIEEAAKEFEKELDKQNQDGGAGKRNPTPNEADRTDAGQKKPQPMDGMAGMGNSAEPKPEPKPDPKQPNPADPMGKPDTGAGETKPQGDVKQPDNPAATKPQQPKDSPKPDPKNAPSEKRDEPLGGTPGNEKEQPKEPPPAPKDPNQKQDPNSGAQGKPESGKKEGDPSGAPGAGDMNDKKDPAAKAGSQAKPSPETTRGSDKPPAQPNEQPPAGNKPKGDTEAGESKPKQSPPAGGAKPMSKDGTTPKGMDTETKPEEGANNPTKPNGTDSAEIKPDDAKKLPMGSGGKPVDKGSDKATPGAGGAGGGGDAPKPKRDEKQQKELQDAANDLSNPDPMKKDEARQKFDRALGEAKRKELEKLANDAKSPDAKTREDALKKLKDEMQKQQDGASAGKEPDKNGDGPKVDPKRAKDIQAAANDLTDPDPKKQQEAREKLDKLIGEASRKELEKTLEDMKSADKAKQAAAQKKFDELKKEMEKLEKKDGRDAKGKEPSPEEIADLMKKAQDLQSPDAKTREQAEKDLDDKIGKENREKLQEELKNKKLDPKEIEQLQKQMEEWRQGLGRGTRAKGLMEDDPKNRLKSAELLLEQFEKEENRAMLQAKKGWTDPEYEKFLKGVRDSIEKQREALKNGTAGDKPPPGAPTDPTTTHNPGEGRKVTPLSGATGGPAGVGGTTAAPPGFEDARRKFEEALKKKP